MATITIRVTDDERDRIDEIAAALTAAEGNRWTKLGRGDVVRLAMLLLESRVTGDVEASPAFRAQRSHGSYTRRTDPPEVRLERLLEHVPDAAPPAPMPGQTTIDDGPALGIDVDRVTRRGARA